MLNFTSAPHLGLSECMVMMHGNGDPGAWFILTKVNLGPIFNLSTRQTGQKRKKKTEQACMKQEENAAPDKR